MNARHANRLRHLRDTSGLTLFELAVITGIPPSSLSRMERGLRSITDDQKLVLADYFEVSVEHLMGWDRQPIPNNNGSEVA